MNNSNYAAEQIVNILIKRGWVATNAYDVSDLIREVSSIITNSSIANIQLSTSVDNITKTFDSGDTYTYTL
jgi:hypothetical protein